MSDGGIAGAGRWADVTMYVLVGVGCFFVLLTSSSPGLPFLLLASALVAWLIAGALWLVLALETCLTRRWRASLVVAPLVVLVTVVVGFTPWPLQARFTLARSSFEKVLRAPMPVQQIDQPVERIGTYLIRHQDRDRAGAFFDTAAGSGLIDSAGFAFVSDPAMLEDAGYIEWGRNLGGGWHEWTRRF